MNELDRYITESRSKWHTGIVSSILTLAAFGLIYWMTIDGIHVTVAGADDERVKVLGSDALFFLFFVGMLFMYGREIVLKRRFGRILAEIQQALQTDRTSVTADPEQSDSAAQIHLSPSNQAPDRTMQ